MKATCKMVLIVLVALTLGMVSHADAVMTKGLLCGINDYKFISNDLSYPVADATNLYNLILGYGGSKANFKTLTGSRATKRGIQTDIKSLASRAKAGEVVLFYFSGHGSNGGGKTYICPYDTTSSSYASMISEDELQQWLSAITAKGATVVVILDTCYSGGFLTKSLALGDKRLKARPKVWPGTPPLTRGRLAATPKGLDQPGFIVMTAAAENQSAWEDTWLQSGVFSYYLRLAASGPADDAYLQGDVPGTFDRNVTAAELFSGLLALSRVYETGGYPVGFNSYSDPQEPQVNYGASEDTGLFLMK